VRVLVTVPAFRMLWGLQDRVSQHKRRYRMAELVARLEQAGLGVHRRFHFNYLLFLPILLARRIIALFGNDLQSENQVNSPSVNRVLSWVFRFDVWTAPIVKPPFGVSCLAVAGHRR